MRFGVALGAFALLPVLLGAAPKHKHSLKDLRRQHAATALRVHVLRLKAHKVRAAAHRVRVDIQTIDGQISDHIAELADIAVRMKTNKKLQVVLKKQLEEATTRLAIRSQQARLRIREMYMHGDDTLASALVGTTSLADLSSKQFVFERIAQRDRQLFEQVKELRQNVVDASTKAHQVAQQIKRDMDREQTAKSELEDERQDKSQALQDLKDQEGEIEQLLHQLDQEDADILSEIQSYEAGPGAYHGVYRGGKFLLPVFGARFSSGFGMRYHPILHRMRMHTGQDLAAPMGSPIHAAADGVVVACHYMRGYGNAIIVDHGSGYATLYGHCSRIIAHPGQQVRRGEVIALVGMTGLATGPHCHFEVRIHGRPVNPLPYLRG